MAEVILALDLPSKEDAWSLIDAITEVRWVKVGSVLATSGGPEFVRKLTDRGLQVFLDLKWHDIPNTVAGAVAGARDLGVAMATVHTLGGPRMVAAAAEAAGPLALVGVTVLTSHTSEEWAATLGRGGADLRSETARLASLGWENGLAGVVCSPQEIEVVRPVMGEGARIVTPGVRRTVDRAGDQARVATPAQAAAAGASHLVVGRPVLDAEDPLAVFRAFVEEARCDR